MTIYSGFNPSKMVISIAMLNYQRVEGSSYQNKNSCSWWVPFRFHQNRWCWQHPHHPRKRTHQRSQPINHPNHPSTIHQESAFCRAFSISMTRLGFQSAVRHGDVLTIFDGLLQNLLLQTYGFSANGTGMDQWTKDRVPLNPFHHRSPIWSLLKWQFWGHIPFSDTPKLKTQNLKTWGEVLLVTLSCQPPFGDTLNPSRRWVFVDFCWRTPQEIGRLSLSNHLNNNKIGEKGNKKTVLENQLLVHPIALSGLLSLDQCPHFDQLKHQHPHLQGGASAASLSLTSLTWITYKTSMNSPVCCTIFVGAAKNFDELGHNLSP